MTDHENGDRESRLEERIAELEERIRWLETRVGANEADAADVAPVDGAPAGAAAADVAPARPLATTQPATGWTEPKGFAPTPTPPPGAMQPPPAPATSQPASAAVIWTPVDPVVRMPRPSVSVKDLEARLTGRALAWVGAAALILGAIFFLSLAFSRGWIGPDVRVLLGLAGGAAGLVGGFALLERGNRLIGHALTAVGLAVISISLIAGTRLYGLIPVELGLGLALITAVAAAYIAVRTDSQVVAGFGLVTVLAAPPLLGAAPDLTTLAFVGAALVGTTAVALWRSWPWLPIVAFLVVAPQIAAWILGAPEPGPTLALASLGVFWLLNVVAAGGEELRHRTHALRPSSAVLLLANVAFLVWAGFVVLDGNLATYRWAFLVLVAVAHFGIGGYFLWRDGELDPFGLLAIGAGLAALTMAAPVGLDGPVVPVAWTAQAVALAWIAAWRGHPFSAAASGVLFALAGWYLIARHTGAGTATGSPEGNAAALAFFAGGVALGIWFLRDRAVRAVLATFGLIVVAACTWALLDDAPWVVALSALLVVGAALLRWAPRLPDRPIPWQLEGRVADLVRAAHTWRPTAESLLPATLVVLGAVAAGAIGLRLYPPRPPAVADPTPFLDPAGAALAAYLVALTIVGWLVGDHRRRQWLAALGIGVVAWASFATLGGVRIVAAWAALMVIGFAIWRGLHLHRSRSRAQAHRFAATRRTIDPVLPGTALVIGGLAALHVMAVELPLDRLDEIVLPSVPFSDAGALAGTILIGAALLVGLLVGGRDAHRWSILVAIGIAAYIVPFEVSPWAVAVLWSTLAVGAILLARRDVPSITVDAVAVGLALLGAAAVVAVAIVAPPTRLVVGEEGLEPIVAARSLAALGSVTAGIAVLARYLQRTAWAPWSRFAWLIAGIGVVYLLSILVVDLIATRVGAGDVPLATLRTWGQVALSVLWTVIGVSAFVVGLRMGISLLRQAGLVLLAIATVKVFLVDLSALDAAYRVVSLMVLGTLLLVAAWLWQRSRTGGPAGDPGSAP